MLQNKNTNEEIFSALFTDFYSLTMMQGYFLENKNPQVVCDVFFRSQPFDGGFSIFCGLETLLKRLQKVRFTKDDIQYLRKQTIFCEEFLEFLKTFTFSGDVFSIQEGSVCFPFEPIIRIHASMLETQLIEALVLNTINYQTLIATKSARINLSASSFGADGKKTVEFGMRRAQGLDGALSASRAAFVGGVSATSNVQAGKKFNIPVSGTMSHAWVMSFENEKKAFEKYANIYPDNTVFLLDTYNTLKSGLPNAIIVGKKLQKEGKKFGVRLDSGDIEYLSQQVRFFLDKAGLTDAFIVISNDLNEKIISELTANLSPVDVWGVGTSLVTGETSAALTGVYKLCAIEKSNGGVENKEKNQHIAEFIPTMKISNQMQKSTLPCIKQVYRFSHEKTNLFLADLIVIEGQEKFQNIISEPVIFHHPFIDHKFFSLQAPAVCEPLLKKVLSKGKICAVLPSLGTIQTFVKKQLSKLDKTSKRLINPHIYCVSISAQLKKTRDAFIVKKENQIYR